MISFCAETKRQTCDDFFPKRGRTDDKNKKRDEGRGKPAPSIVLFPDSNSQGGQQPADGTTQEAQEAQRTQNRQSPNHRSIDDAKVRRRIRAKHAAVRVLLL